MSLPLSVPASEVTVAAAAVAVEAKALQAVSDPAYIFKNDLNALRLPLSNATWQAHSALLPQFDAA
jgi:hypothetical protein